MLSLGFSMIFGNVKKSSKRKVSLFFLYIDRLFYKRFLFYWQEKNITLFFMLFSMAVMLYVAIFS